MLLISKIQYNNFEPGEFVDEKERGYEETIALIEQFPWETQRTNHVMGPTNSSVTIQGDNKNYLKLTFFYNKKFVLYYLDADDHLYTRSLEQYKESFPFIQSLFSSPSQFDTTDFKLEHVWMQGKSIHFKDKDFQYSVSKSSLWQIASLCALMAFLLILSGFFIVFKSGTQKLGFIPLVVLVAFLAPSLLNVAIKNYRICRNKVLILSKGNDIFYYGPAGQPEKFDKKDINQITFYGGKTRRDKLRGYSEIEFKENPVGFLYISDMILSDVDLQAKLPGIPVSYNMDFPVGSIPSSF